MAWVKCIHMRTSKLLCLECNINGSVEWFIDILISYVNSFNAFIVIIYQQATTTRTTTSVFPPPVRTEVPVRMAPTDTHAHARMDTQVSLMTQTMLNDHYICFSPSGKQCKYYHKVYFHTMPDIMDDSLLQRSDDLLF